MNAELVLKAEAFLKETFAASEYLQNNPSNRDYRLEHSYRVANLAKTIAEKEGMNVTNAVIAGLLHDIAYFEEMSTREDWKNHGRKSASFARPFLKSLGLPECDVEDICYSIAIHVDDEADFIWQRTSFSEIVGDADNMDRFDTYRIYETLQSTKFSEKNLSEKKQAVCSMLEQLHHLRDVPFGSNTADTIWKQRLDFYISYYEKLDSQLDHSGSVL